MLIPSFEALKEVSNRFKKANIQHALGGSGLLYYLGLVDEVQDWDITTDAPWDKVKPELVGLNFSILPPTEMFATEFFCKIKFSDTEKTSIDLMGRFAIKTAGGIEHLPTIIKGEWNGVPLSDPAVWMKAYKLMNRDQKYNLLKNHKK